jgi:general secretion pathway protein M
MIGPAGARLEAWYGALDAREQTVVRYGSLAGLVLLLAVILLQAHAGVRRAEQRLERKRADLAYIAAVLPELRAVPMPQGAGQSLPLIVDRTVRDAGLAANLKSAEPAGQAAVRVHLEGAAFEALVNWLVRVQREYGLAVQTATLEKTGAPGRVNATISLVRP